MGAPAIHTAFTMNFQYAAWALSRPATLGRRTCLRFPSLVLKNRISAIRKGGEGKTHTNETRRAVGRPGK